MFSLSASLSHTHTYICSHKPAHTLLAEGGKGVSWISLYTSENWPNSPNYGITWANLIHHRNYLASAPSHTHINTQAQTNQHRHTQCTPAVTTEGADLIWLVT